MAVTKKQRILFVCDDAFADKPYIEELQDEGYEVVVAGHGVPVDEAIKILTDRDQHFDLVITNMFMAYGFNFNAALTSNGYNTGMAFAADMRERGIKSRFLFSDLSTGFYGCEGRIHGGKLTMPGGEDIPVYIKHGSVRGLVEKVKSILSPGAAAGRNNEYRGFEPA